MGLEVTKAQALRMSKKQVVALCGYINIKALCKAHPDLRRPHCKSPSKKMLIKALELR